MEKTAIEETTCTSKISICFCAIFRNEAARVRRCLDAVKSIVDYVAITDTGSTDDTVGAVSAWGEESGIPVAINFDVWENFGENRTRAFRFAKKAFPRSTYMLLLDADMVLEIGLDFTKDTLTKDSYLVRQRLGVASYWNTRLIRANLEWSALMPTHEFWSGGKTSERLTTLVVRDVGDGGSKESKFTRDRDLLLRFLGESTDEALIPRAYFYLAQTQQNLHAYDEAIEAYEKRILAGGWEEEVFLARLYIAHCLLAKGEEEKAIAAYLRAWATRPTRAEPLYHLALYYRRRAEANNRNVPDYRLALHFARMGAKILLPADISFVEEDVYAYRLEQEIVTCAPFVAGKKKHGERAFANLRRKDLPREHKEWLKQAERFYS